MAVPTISSISPAIGPTGGNNLVEIRGTGFQTWVIPPLTGRPTCEPWPTVQVLFGGKPGTKVAVVSDSRLYVRAPHSPLLVAKPLYGEGAVDVVVKNLSSSGVPIAREVATAAAAFTYQRVQLAAESDLGRLCRELVRQMRLQIVSNVAISSHTDFDFQTSDLSNVVDVATLPAVVLFGPDLEQNRFFSISGRIYGPANGYESDQYNAPDTDDLVFTIAGISDHKEEAIGLQSLVRQFFRRNRWIYMDRDPSEPSKGQVRYDLVGGDSLGFQSIADQKSNLRTFSGSFLIRGFDHEALAGFQQSDRTARVFQVQPPPPDPNASKSIVTFDFPLGIGSIGDGVITVTVPQGTVLTALTPTIVHNGASISPASGVAQDFTNPVTYTVTAADGSTKAYVVTVSQLAVSAAMRIGTNFWYHTPLSDNFSGETSMVPGINWSTAYGAGTAGLADTNIWNATFLAELQPYSVLRFMDWANINWSELTSWAQRRLATADNYEAYIDATTTGPNPGVAYEWQIDLANRTSSDLWICIPAKATDDFCTQLATLIKNKLQSARRVYVEYSNETWNDLFGQKQYTIDQGVAAGLPGSNTFYKGQSFVVKRSLQIFDLFQAVFGADAMGTRVVRVFAYGGNLDTGRQALHDVYQSPSLNATLQTIDMLALAPYIGSSLDGSSPTIQTQFHAAVDTLDGNEVAQAVADKNTFGIAQLGAYEGGQHLLLNSKVWTMNPAIYDEYRYMLDKWGSHFSLFMHYTHTGTWTDAADKSSWGALDHTGQSPAEAHKYRALIDWKLANP